MIYVKPQLLFGATSWFKHLLPQNPVSKPTEKQLLSWLNVADSEYGPMDSSITWRVFIAEVPTKHSWSKRLNTQAGPSTLQLTIEVDVQVGTCTV